MDTAMRKEIAVYRLVQGEKTRLRPAAWGFSEEELRRRYQWSLDDELQYWSGTIPGGRYFQQFASLVGQRDWPNDGRRISYAILTNEDNLIGMVSLYNIDRRHQTGEIGIYVGEKSLWSHGYGSDALIAFLRHLFTDLGFQSVYLHTYESNVRAQRSYLRVGFEMAERRRRYSSRLGYHNELRMTISAESFALRNGTQQPAVAS
ncbi:MAG: GNAT family protein [Chloroflexota bacterium]